MFVMCGSMLCAIYVCCGWYACYVMYLMCAMHATHVMHATHAMYAMYAMYAIVCHGVVWYRSATRRGRILQTRAAAIACGRPHPPARAVCASARHE